MSIDKILDRNNPEQHLNKIGGWLPGIVLDLEDPEKLGRIRVKCPLIDSEKPLPNNNDGWVQMLNRSSGAGTPGGTNELIQVGDQIVLLTMMGDVRSCIGIGVLHSIADPPSPHFNRQAGVYGSHSPNGDIQIKDEAQRRSLSTFNGNTEVIDSEGNKTIESPGGAKVTVGAQGDVRIENKEGTIGLADSGELTVSNGKATFGFNSKGEVDISIGNTPGIKFTEFGTYISGQKDDVSRNMSQVKENTAATFSSFSIWNTQLLELVNELRLEQPYEDRISVIYQIDEILEIMVPALLKVKIAIPPLIALSQTEALDIGAKVVGQIDKFRDSGLTQIAEKYSTGFDDDAIDNIAIELSNVLDENVFRQIDIEKLQTVLRGLKHNPEEQFKSTLESVLPLSQIDAVIGNELHKNTERLNQLRRKIDELGIVEILDKIDSKNEINGEELSGVMGSIAGFSSIAPPITPGASLTMIAGLKKITEQIRSGIGKLKGNLDIATNFLNDITEFRNNTDLEEEFGNAGLKEINKLLVLVEAVAPQGEVAVALESLTTALLRLNDIDEVSELVLIKGLLDEITNSTDNPKYDNLEFDEGEGIKLNSAIAVGIEDLITDISYSVLPDAITALLNSISEGMTVGFTTIKALDSIISSNTTGGGIDITDSGSASSADSGKTGGNVVQDKESAAIYGKGANRGVGAKVVADAENAVLAAAGSDAKLGGKVVAKPLWVEIKAPGAELGLGTWFNINQQEAYFYAPGGENDLGSTIFLDQENINLFAPGSKGGAGSSINLETESVGVFAPGGKNGSSLVLNLDYAHLFSPGGARRGGTKLKLAPDKLTLSYPGITGGNIVMSNNRIKIDLPVLQNSVELTATGVTIKSMLAKVKVSQSMINLSVGGTGIKILPGVVLVNGVPLQLGSNLF